MTLATALSFTFAGFLVQAIGWRRVYGVGGLIDVACALILGLALRGGVRSERPRGRSYLA